jgi:hypothetical protein
MKQILLSEQRLKVKSYPNRFPGRVLREAEPGFKLTPMHNVGIGLPVVPSLGLIFSAQLLAHVTELAHAFRTANSLP